MKKNPTWYYKPKKLIPGSDIEPGMTGFYAGVPDRNYKDREFIIQFTYPAYAEKVDAPRYFS